MLLLEGDQEMIRWLAETSPDAAASVLRERASTQSMFAQPLSIVGAMGRQRTASRICSASVRRTGSARKTRRERIGDALTRPFWGALAAAAFLYFGMYLFVGKFGAGVVVDFLEKSVFLRWINPWAVRGAERLIPWPVVRDLFTGEFGILTLGIRYAVAIILPLVTVFFLVFAVIEDSGYLPRLAMLLDGAFKKIGLSGRAVIPIILGFGCDTMATLVTRTLATRRERLIATLLLALAIPCSAQLGVIIGLLHGHPAAFTVWGTVIAASFLLVGFLGARLLPGQGAIFFLEIPPMRWPSPVNVWRKTAGRVIWYMEEVLPFFVYISAVAWAAKAAGVFDALVSSLAVPLGWMGLPPVSAPAFLFGFVRRDYGAAGLYDLHTRHALSVMQLAIATVVLTLFLPCIAQFMIMGRERGWRAAVAITGFVGVAAFAAGLVLARLLPVLGGASW
jgi:ferrous iron transport protein B